MAVAQTMDDDEVDGVDHDVVPESDAAPISNDARPGRVARQLARRRRREQLGGILIALLGVAVLVVAFVALRHPRNTGTAAGTDTRNSTPAQVSSAPSNAGRSASGASSGAVSGPTATGTEPLIVVNQSQTADLAHQAAARFRHGGWRITSVQETFDNNVLTTTAYYDPAVPGAEAAAQALRRQFAGIHRVAPRFTPVPAGEALPAGPVVVVLTDDYAT